MSSHENIRSVSRNLRRSNSSITFVTGDASALGQSHPTSGPAGLPIKLVVPSLHRPSTTYRIDRAPSVLDPARCAADSLALLTRFLS